MLPNVTCSQLDKVLLNAFKLRALNKNFGEFSIVRTDCYMKRLNNLTQGINAKVFRPSNHVDNLIIIPGLGNWPGIAITKGHTIFGISNTCVAVIATFVC
jgi:hypothetical protein